MVTNPDLYGAGLHHLQKERQCHLLVSNGRHYALRHNGFGQLFPLQMPALFGIPPTGVWTIILLLYAFWASVLPVTTLLQPRDFINAYQLLIAMLLMTAGILAAGLSGRLELVAPAVQMHPAEAPSMWPFLFITIACGAISGFHSLVASGTSSKQVKSEPDALFVGYGSMLTEGALATLVIAAVAGGIGLGYKAADGSTLLACRPEHALRFLDGRCWLRF